MTTRTTHRLMALAGLLGLAPAALAQDFIHPKLEERFIFRVGGILTDARPVIGLSADGIDPIDLIDLSREGYDTENSSFMAAFDWNITQRWSLDFQYYRDEVRGTRATNQDYEWGDVLIPAGSGLNVSFDTDFYILRGTYDFFQGPSYKAGAGIGIYGLDLDASLGANIGDNEFFTESADTLAPLPTLAAYGEWAFNRHLILNASVAWLSAEYDQYDGDVWAVRANLEYWFNANWGVGAGYQLVDFELEADEDPFRFFAEVDWSGPSLYLTAGF